MSVDNRLVSQLELEEDTTEECELIRSRIESENSRLNQVASEIRLGSPRKLESVQRLFSDIPVHGLTLEPARYQRVNISPEAAEDVTQETTNVASKLLKLMKLREKYLMAKPEPNWGSINQERFHQVVKDAYAEAEAKGSTLYRRRLEPPFLPFDHSMFNCDSAAQVYGNPLVHKFVDGVVQVFHTNPDGTAKGENLFPVLPQKEYYTDLNEVVKFVHDAPSKSFCFKRLQLLDARFKLHQLLNAGKESAVQKAVPHRDFYNIRKVDTHIHHSAIMNQKHLLRFIKHKLKTCPSEVVVFRDNKYLTLEQVFLSLNLSAYDLSIDTLDMHADNTFHRFDRFNLKYNPIGESRLREIFLKTDNLIGGRYLAEVTKEVFSDAEANKYVLMEPRISVYGRNMGEWTKLASWYYENKLSSPTTRWMIQIPRLYSVYKSANLVNSFQDILDNMFKPLFDVTMDPSIDPKLDNFLNQIVGIDCVDDESKFDRSATLHEHPIPAEWTKPENPPYSYWIYYIYANLKVLNTLRASMNKSIFEFRPHCGEAGDMNNLACSFLCADAINHGIMLRKLPAMQYMYYLAQIGLALSPLSNNKLFLDYHANPFPAFFARGLNVSLSTDDPLMLHITKEPLVEEYSVATQVWKLSSTDMCEIARNSVLQSGFEHPYKVHYIGENYHLSGPEGNDIKQTNVPDIRVLYRKETLEEEWSYVRSCSQTNQQDAN